MSIWAIADLHLSFGVPNKEMSVFGEMWQDHAQKIATHWRERISPEDLVLIAGDISWAMHTEDALPDLQWIHDLPGTKVIIKGNHDYWWSSFNKVTKILPPSILAIQNSSLKWQNVSIAGARMWDTDEYAFNEYIAYNENPRAKNVLQAKEPDQKIFLRELHRLELSLQSLHPDASVRIAMTHYPPISANLQPSVTSALLEKYHVDICVFGHLHSLKPGIALFGTKNGIQYHLTSCDFLNFCPIKIMP
jgi:uncharacterized protein